MLLLVLLVATGIGVGVGCRGEDEATDAKPEASSVQPPEIQPGKSPGKSPRMGHPGTLREQLGSEVDLPDGYPDDAPRYPGAKVNASSGAPGQGVAATFSTKDPVDKVTSYLRQDLASNGWESLPDDEFPTGVFVHAAKPAEGRKITLMIAKADQGDNDFVTLIAVVTQR